MPEWEQQFWYAEDEHRKMWLIKFKELSTNDEGRYSLEKWLAFIELYEHGYYDVIKKGSDK